MIEFPRRRRGHQGAEAKAEYAEQLGAFCEAILKYVSEDAPQGYQDRLENHQDAVRDEVHRLLEERWGS